MRIMAIDYGDARTGISVSDRDGIMPGESWIIKEWNAERLAAAVAEEAKKREVGLLVLGCPKNMDGSLGPRAEKSAAFGELLREATGLEVVMWDERLTTVDAYKILDQSNRYGKKRKQTVDAVAASLILEGYLNSKR